MTGYPSVTVKTPEQARAAVTTFCKLHKVSVVQAARLSDEYANAVRLNSSYVLDLFIAGGTPATCRLDHLFRRHGGAISLSLRPTNSMSQAYAYFRRHNA